MIIGIGIDMIEVGRVKDRVAKEGFKKKVFTEAEISYCENQGIPAQHYAARFAAKEAFFKALGTGWRGSMEFNEIEVVHDDSGQPKLRLYGGVLEEAKGKGTKQMHVSLTHLKATAAAVVLLEG